MNAIPGPAGNLPSSNAQASACAFFDRFLHRATAPSVFVSSLQPVPSLSFSHPPAGHQIALIRVRSGEIGGPGTGMAFSVSGLCHSERPVILSVSLVILSVSEESVFCK